MIMQMTNFPAVRTYVVSHLHRAYDGDTITVDIDLGFGVELKEQTLRLARIDAPELRGEERIAGIEARDHLRMLLDDDSPYPGPIFIQTEKSADKGKYGRWIATVWKGDLNVNAAMVSAGHAVWRDY